MIKQGEKFEGMVTVMCDGVARFGVFSSTRACWPVEGGAALVAPIAGARHDLFFTPANFISLSRPTCVPPDEDYQK